MSDATPQVPTLFDWAGGAPGFERLVDAFYDRVEGDELLAPLFPGGVTPEHRRHVTWWWCEVSAALRTTPSGSAATSGCWPTTAASRSPRRSPRASRR